MGNETSQAAGQPVSAGPPKPQYNQYLNQHERFSDEKFDRKRGGGRFGYQKRGGRRLNQNKGTSRDPSPTVSECSSHGGGHHRGGHHRGGHHRGGHHRGGHHRGGPPRDNQPRKNFQKNSFGGVENQPPKYEDAVKRMGENKEKYQKNTQYKGQNEGGFQKRNPNTPSASNLGSAKTVDSLNDLLKKEFGSLGGPTHNLPAVEASEKPFSGRNCLYIGNLPADLSREEVNALMSAYGDVTVDYYNPDKKFGFIRLKHREQAENAQRNLDGFVFKGRRIKVRLSSSTARFKVLNLTLGVTNELLKKAFTAFGEVERAEIVVEDGKPTGEGFIEFSDKRAGQAAMEACIENCFLLTASLRPVMLEEMEPDTGLRGFSERQLPTNNPECKKSREVGPRFLAEGSSEYACAILWKTFTERKRQEEEELAEKFRLEEEQLEARIDTLLKAEQSLFKK